MIEGPPSTTDDDYYLRLYRNPSKELIASWKALASYRERCGCCGRFVKGDEEGNYFGVATVCGKDDERHQMYKRWAYSEGGDHLVASCAECGCGLDHDRSVISWREWVTNRPPPRKNPDSHMKSHGHDYLKIYG